MSHRTAIIIGAGPAGLTAAYELLARTDVVPIVLEMSDCLGGIARTVNYKGNRMDIGGHRFFSKSDRVFDWWLARMPLERTAADAARIAYRSASRDVKTTGDAPDPHTTDRVMLVRKRKSRIYFLRQFFDYPLQFGLDTARKLGLTRTAKIALSYARAAIFGKKNPKNLEEFFISRFGRELYQTFFKSYTEKVWGESCAKISAEWGAQRIKGLSISKAVAHFVGGLVRRQHNDLRQKSTETSLIENFMYPKLGPGQMWEIVADEVRQRGGTVLLNQQVAKLHLDQSHITAVEATNTDTGETTTYQADFVFSTMPIKELVTAINGQVPDNVRAVANGLIYRDFITVGLLVKRLKVRDQGASGPVSIADNWIYIQEPDVRLGRLQVFNNWSPYLVADPNTVWIGLEYFCNQGEPLWQMSDAELIRLATGELAQIEIIDADDVLDGTVIRMAKTYPAYFGSYDRFDEIRSFTDQIANLFLIGRNGMHKYNNQDHSMLTAMAAVDNIAAGRQDKANIWAVNAEQDYQESE